MTILGRPDMLSVYKMGLLIGNPLSNVMSPSPLLRQNSMHSQMRLASSFGGHAFSSFCVFLSVLMSSNATTIKSSKSFRTNEPQSHPKRHVNIAQSWARQEVLSGGFQVRWVPSAQIMADGTTKNLPIGKFRQYLALLNMFDLRHRIASSV